MWAPHRLVSLFRHLVISSSCHPAILSCPETSVSLLRRGRGVGWVVYVVVDKSVTYDQHIKYQQSHMTGIPVLTGIPVTPWKRVRCCAGTAIRNPYPYPSIPVTGYPRCYPYPCHSLIVAAGGTMLMVFSMFALACFVAFFGLESFGSSSLAAFFVGFGALAGVLEHALFLSYRQ